MKKIIKKVFISIFIFGILFLVGGCTNGSSITTSSTVSTTTSNIPKQNIVYKVEETFDETNDIVDAVDEVFDSVVVINAYSRNSQGSGSGVMFAESETYTYIITCHHVIDGASSFEVITSDETEYNAILIGGDPNTDIAVLAIQATNMSLSNFVNNSDLLKVGQTAIAIGNPLGTLANTVTTGVVSSKERQITMSDGSVETLIQTDAAINSGNSGGGLFNINGQLIGIVNAKYSATGVEGLGFAIPANTARTIASELLEKGYVSGRYNLGVTFKDGIYATSGFFGERYEVVYVYAIDSNGSAYNILKENDIIGKLEIDYSDETKTDISLDDIESADSLNSFIKNANLEIGDKLTFTIKRNGYSGQATTVDVIITQYIYSI